MALSPWGPDGEVPVPFPKFSCHFHSVESLSCGTRWGKESHYSRLVTLRRADLATWKADSSLDLAASKFWDLTK